MVTAATAKLREPKHLRTRGTGINLSPTPTNAEYEMEGNALAISTDEPGQLSLAIHSWVGAMCTGKSWGVNTGTASDA